METRWCTKCEVEHPIEDFYVIKTKRRDGSIRYYTYNYCRKQHYKMTKPKRKQWVKDNPERIRFLQNKATKKYIENLPGGIYLIQTDIGLYVGQTQAIKWRIGQHKHSNQFGVAEKGGKIISWVVLEYIDDPVKRLRREKYWIKTLQPALNVRHK